MTLITKPDFTYVWASGGAVVAPNDAKKQQGWVAEAPPFQYDNWLQNRQDQMLAHINQRGIPAWDGLTDYEAGGLSYVQGSDGKVYKSVAASGPSSVVSNPTTDGTDTYWTIAFADVGAFLTQAAGDARYTQRSNNLSDLTNVATARTNLGAAPLASPAFTGVPSAPTATAGTNTTQLANTAFVKAAVDAAPMLGVGQTWQDVMGSRSSGTTYTNTTGRPIELSIGALQPTPDNIIISISINSGSFFVFATGSNSGGGQQTAGSMVIPVGATYNVTNSAGSISHWWELR